MFIEEEPSKVLNNYQQSNYLAFKEVRSRINEIKIQDAYKPIFVEMMDKFADYFAKNEYIQLDIKDLFDKFLYQKLEIKPVTIDKIRESGHGVNGVFIFDRINGGGTILIKNGVSKMNITELNGLKHEFAHEFVHFIIHNAYPNSPLPTWADEMLTEITARQIMGLRSASYENIVYFGKLLSRFVEPFLNNDLSNSALFFNGEFNNYLKRNNLYGSNQVTKNLQEEASHSGIVGDLGIIFSYIMESAAKDMDISQGINRFNLNQLYKVAKNDFTSAPFNIVRDILHAYQFKYRFENGISDKRYYYIDLDKESIKRNFSFDYESIRNADEKTIYDVMNKNGNLDKFQKLLEKEKELKDSFEFKKPFDSNMLGINKILEEGQFYFDLHRDKEKCFVVNQNRYPLPSDFEFNKSNINNLMMVYGVELNDYVQIEEEGDMKRRHVLAGITREGEQSFKIVLDPNDSFYMYSPREVKNNIFELRKEIIGEVDFDKVNIESTQQNKKIELEPPEEIEEVDKGCNQCREDNGRWVWL